jgi:hypothetical protein
MDQVINTAFLSISYKNIANYPYLQFKKTNRSSRFLALSLAKANIIDISSKDKLFLKKILPIGQNINSVSSLLYLVDIFYTKEFSEQNLKKSFMLSFEFLKRIMGDESIVPKKDVLKSFESQIKYLSTIKRTIKDSTTIAFINKYIQNISDLLRAYKENDSSYFYNNSLGQTSENVIVDKHLSKDNIIEESVGTDGDVIEEIDNE